MEIEKLIEKLRTESLYKDKATLEIMDLCMDAALALEQLQAENDRLKEEVQQMRWIPVEERLPKPEFKDQQRGFYLVTLSNGVVKELIYEFRHYDNMMFDVGWHDTALPVTHWMPLPAVPKEVTHEK